MYPLSNLFGLKIAILIKVIESISCGGLNAHFRIHPNGLDVEKIGVRSTHHDKPPHKPFQKNPEDGLNSRSSNQSNGWDLEKIWAR
jgi:hypothetical protein